MADDVCTACGAPASAGARFCGQCGTALGGADAAAAPAPSMVAAAPSVSGPVAFDASKPPAPGAAVPHDCVWARFPHPGALPARIRGGVLQEVQEMAPLTGRTFREVQPHLGIPAGQEKLAGGGRLTARSAWEFWSSRKQTVTVQFDRYGVCGGVVDRHVSGGSGGVGVVVGIDL